jgi:hypothetical protein
MAGVYALNATGSRNPVTGTAAKTADETVTPELSNSTTAAGSAPRHRTFDSGQI